MRCPRCSRESKDGTVYCPGCGAPLSLRTEPAAAALDATLDLDRRAADEVRGPVIPREARGAFTPPQQPQVARPTNALGRPAAPPGPAPRPPPIASSQARSTAAPPAPAAEPAPTPPSRPAPPARPGSAPAAMKPEPRPPPPAQPHDPFAPGQDRSQWDMRLSQMPRERRVDLGPGPLPAPAQRAVLAPEAQPEPSGTLEVEVGPVEIHLRRAPDWKRCLAWVLDGLPFAALFVLALRVALGRLPHSAPLDLSTALDLAGAEAADITGPVFGGALVLFAVYHLLAHGMSGATLGKRLVGIRVVGPDGQRPSLGRATLRAALEVLSLLLLGLGVILALFTRSGRALHDLIARTWVVEAP